MQETNAGVEVTVAVAVRVGVAITVDVFVGVGVRVAVNVAMGVSVRVAVEVAVGVRVRVAVEVAVGVSVRVAVAATVAVFVGVCVRVGVFVGMGVLVAVGVTMGVVVPVMGVLKASSGLVAVQSRGESVKLSQCAGIKFSSSSRTKWWKLMPYQTIKSLPSVFSPFTKSDTFAIQGSELCETNFSHGL